MTEETPPSTGATLSNLEESTHGLTKYLSEWTPSPTYSILFFTLATGIIAKLISKLKRRCNVDADINALHKATYKNDTIEAIRLVRKNPLAVNSVIDSEGFTPFLRASYHGNTQLVKYMLRLDVDVTVRTSRGENAMYLATYNRIRNKTSKDASCIHALFYAGVDINARAVNGLNVLQLAAMFGHKSLVQWLLSKGADFNVAPSPYLLAKSAGHPDTAKYLRELHDLSLTTKIL